MAEGSHSSPPQQFYQSFIDELVKATQCAQRDSIVKKGVYSNAKLDRPLNELVASLSPGQRELLVQLIERERRNAFHHVLAQLEWWVYGGQGAEIAYKG